MMAETDPLALRGDAQGKRRRPGRTAELAFGAIYLAFAVFALLFALVTWLAGRLNPINVLVFALAMVGTAPSGLMALRGDYPGARMDEGQRQTYHAALSDAFHVAYFGLYAVFFGSIFFPWTHLSVQVALGGLLLLVTLTWVGGVHMATLAALIS
ncbi:MAG TPA: hypothetical protein VF916_13745 [Ktedonobacterales bacterium]